MDSLSKGYIKPDEIDFIRSFMWDNEGSILEVGAFVGKTFHYLYQYRPNWEYTGLDPWESYPWPMEDPNIPYSFNINNPLLHSKYFKQNCPFSHCVISDYEDCAFSNNTFDVIVMSGAGTWMNVGYMWYKAIHEIKEDGIIIGRYLNHPKYGDRIKSAIDIIDPENFIDYNGSMFAIW